MDNEEEYFTLVFKGNLRKFAGNPLKTDTPFGVPSVTHHAIHYGTFLEEMQNGYILRLLKQTIFRATRDTICEHSEP